MIRKITQISFAVAFVLLLVSCKNTKQKIQEHVSAYNNSSALFTGDNITGTTAKGFLAKNKIEIRILTDLEMNESNKLIYGKAFPGLLTKMIKEDQVSMELVDEGVAFDVYFLAKNNTILAQQLIDKDEMLLLLKQNSKAAEAKDDTAKL